jgi:Caenorhabditis protein of unknown function, DUF268
VSEATVFDNASLFLNVVVIILNFIYISIPHSSCYTVASIVFLSMYYYLRQAKRVLHQGVAFLMSPFILKDYLAYRSKDTTRRFKIPFASVMPCLFENTPYTRFDTHYIYHTAWAARKVREIDASSHTDISSILYFSAIISAFKEVHFYDYRPASLNLTGLTSSSADLLMLPFPDNSIASLSCMHTVEHVGLGRYGDTIDPEGDVRAAKELARVTKKGGSLLFVVPVGKPKIQFNAHRIYSYDMVIPDDALTVGIINNAAKSDVNKQKYGCGCFWFVKE